MMRYTRIVCVLLLAGFSVAIAFSTLVFFWVPYEETGVSLNGDVVDAVPAGSPAAKAGLRVGDRLDPATSFFDRERIGWPNQPARGQTYTFNVLRDGRLHTINVHAAKQNTVPPWSREDAVEYIVGMLAFLTLITVGTLLVLVRPTPLTWLFFLFCVGNPTSKYFGAIDVLSSLPMPLGFILNIIRTTLMIAAYIAFVDFALRFPNQNATGWRARVERFLPLLFLAYLAYDYRNWFWQFYPVDGASILGWPYIDVAIALLCEVIAVASLLGTYRGASTQEKQRLSWVVTGVLVTYSVILLRDALGTFGLLEGDTLWICIISQSLSAFAPLGLGYAILKHRVIDVRFALNRAVVFIAIAGALVSLLLGLDWVFATLFVNSRLQIVLDFAIVSALTLAVRSGYQKLVDQVNRTLFPKRQRRIERVDELQTIANDADFESIQPLLTSAVCESLDLASAALFARTSDGGFLREGSVGWGPATAWHLLADDASVQAVLTKRSRWIHISASAWAGVSVPSDAARPALAIPLVTRKRILGLALYGAHSNATDIDPDEARALADLCALAAPALEQTGHPQTSGRLSPATAARAAATTLLMAIVAACMGGNAVAGTTGSITGRVAEAGSSTPIAGVNVTAASPSQSVSTTSDQTGSFTFISLRPDRYIVTAQKRGYDSTVQRNVSVFADNTRAISLILNKQLRDIANVHTQTAADLVRAGTGSDVYSVDRATAQSAQALGGGGGLNNAYSAIALLPGVYVPQGQKGWAQAVYVRGADTDAVGYEYDGVPVNRAFDNYDSDTASNLGQQQLQLYTSGGPASASATGIAGFINQVIRTGTFPGFATIDAQAGAPAFYHKLGVEAGGASPNRQFSYYAGFSGYNQDFRYVDQSNGGGIQYPYFASVITSPPFQGLVGGAAPACVDGQPPPTLPPGIALPVCYTFGAGHLGNVANISDREAVINVHFAIPHKYDAARDDVQILGNISALDSYVYDSQSDVGASVIQSAFGGPLPWFDSVMFPAGTVFGEPVSDIPVTNNVLCRQCAVYYYPSSPANRAPFAPTPLDKRGLDENDAAIFKFQYQKNFGSSAYLRLFGYTFYSDFLEYDSNNEASFLAPDYELSTHTRGLGLQFAKQLNSKHVLEATMNYTTASTVRFNNYTIFYNFVDSGMTNLLDASGNCYTPGGSIGACNDAGNQGTFENPAPYSSVGAASSAHAAWTVTGATAGLPDIGPYNTVAPRFASMSVEDQFKPNDRLFLDVGLRYEHFGYALPSARSPANDFWYKAAQREFCYDPQTLQPDRGVFTAPEAPCPINGLTGAQEVHPDGKDGHGLITNDFNPYMSSNVLSPRIAFTYTMDPRTVLRASYGRYAQPTDSAVTQYLFKGANLPAFLFPYFWSYSFNTPRHDVQAQVSDSYDLSFEHRLNGTAISFKVTPFLRQTSHQTQFLDLDPVTGFVSGLNVGREKGYGVELAVTAGDFVRDGFSAELAYTYTNANIKFDNFAGSARNAIDGVNDQIRAFNGFTAAGGGFPCYENTTSGSGAGETAAQCAADPAAVANPYYKMSVQPLYDRNAAYYAYDVLANAPGASTSSYSSPHVLSGVIQYKHGKWSVSPSFELNAGPYYGAPLSIPGIDPASCGQNSATAGIAAPDPHQAEYTSCAGFISIPNPENGNRYDGFGQYQNPWHLSLNLQASYAISPKVSATLVLVNVYNRCFGGSVTPWSQAAPPGSHGVCGYDGNGLAPYVSNLYNGFSPNDAAANGGPLNPYLQHAYAATEFTQPFQAFFQIQLKM